jgi:uroporphyrinogen-III decarboxylase
MKGYVNDVGMAASICGPNTVIFGNLNPTDVGNQSEAWIEAELKRQATDVRKHAPFVASTGSPLTPGTSIDRMRTFIDVAHRL